VVARNSAWRLCDDGRGWMADVGFVARHAWGQRKYVLSVPVDRVRHARSDPDSELLVSSTSVGREVPS
jgi:hypothetical protein